MDPLNGGGFPYNIRNTLNEEYFDYGRQWNPNYVLMNEPEIRVEPPQDYYQNDNRSSNHQQMHQIYYDDDRYGNDGYHSSRPGHNYPYALQETHFNYNQEIEYPSHRISVDIRLSRRGFIDDHLIDGLERHDLSCEVRGSVITVSGYPENDGADGFLALVQRISGDRGASIVG